MALDQTALDLNQTITNNTAMAGAVHGAGCRCACVRAAVTGVGGSERAAAVTAVLVCGLEGEWEAALRAWPSGRGLVSDAHEALRAVERGGGEVRGAVVAWMWRAARGGGERFVALRLALRHAHRALARKMLAQEALCGSKRRTLAVEAAAGGDALLVAACWRLLRGQERRAAWLGLWRACTAPWLDVMPPSAATVGRLAMRARAARWMLGRAGGHVSDADVREVYDRCESAAARREARGGLRGEHAGRAARDADIGAREAPGLRRAGAAVAQTHSTTPRAALRSDACPLRRRLIRTMNLIKERGELEI